MNEPQMSLAGIICLVSLLAACGSKSSFEALAAQVSGDGTAENSGKGGKGDDRDGKDHAKRDRDRDDDEDETCDADKYANPKTVVLCAVGDIDEDEPRQVCTDATTARGKYGLDPSKPNLIGSAGDHLGAC